MKKSNFQKGILICAAFALCTMLVQCKGKDGAAGPTGTNGTNGTNGTLSGTGTSFGWVTLVDEFGKPLGNNSGVTVTLLGSNPAISVTTNDSGKYVFSNVPIGTYDLTFTKPGFPTNNRYDYTVYLGPKPGGFYTFSMYKQSTTTISSLKASINVQTYNTPPYNVKFKAIISPRASSTQPRGVIFVYSNSPTVSINDIDYYNYQYNNASTLTTTTSATSDSAVVSVYPNISNPIFTSGKTVYVKAYGVSYNSGGITNPNTLKLEYPSLAPTSSSTTSVVLP